MRLRSIVCWCIVIAASYSALASAQQKDGDYPAKPIRMLVGFSAGGGSDFAARIAGQKLTELLGQNVIIDNRTGANGAIAAEMAARAAPDGYTLFMLAVAHLVGNAFPNKLPYDALRDYEPVSQVTQQPYLAVVTPSLPARSVQELIDLARAKPGQLNYASTGIGGSNHLAAELFNSMAGTRMVHVAYKGPPQALADVLAGQVQFMIASIQTSLPLARSGKLRALGVTSPRRSPAAPDIPTLADTLPGYVSIGWYGLMAPKGTSPVIVNRLSATLAKGLQTPEARARLAADGSEPVGSTPEEYAQHLKSELARFSKVIQDAGIRIE